MLCRNGHQNYRKNASVRDVEALVNVHSNRRPLGRGNRCHQTRAGKQVQEDEPVLMQAIVMATLMKTLLRLKQRGVEIIANSALLAHWPAKMDTRFLLADFKGTTNPCIPFNHPNRRRVTGAFCGAGVCTLGPNSSNPLAEFSLGI